MNKQLRKALLKADYSLTAKLLKEGADLGLDDYDARNLPADRALSDEEMADYLREQMGAGGLPKNLCALLRRAAEADCVELVAILLEKGLDPNRRDEFGNPLWDSVISNNACRVMAYLLKHGLNPNDGTPIEGRDLYYTPMEHATRRGTKRMVQLLLKSGAAPYILKDESDEPTQQMDSAKPVQKMKWKELKGKPTRAQALAFVKGSSKARRSHRRGQTQK